MQKLQIMKLKELQNSYNKLVKGVADEILNESENYETALREASRLLWYTNDHYFIDELKDEIQRRMELEAPSKRD